MVSGEPLALWDAHVHLPAYPAPGEVVAGAVTRGVRLVSVTVSQGEVATNLLLRRQNPAAVRCFIGVHPSEATSAATAMRELAPLWAAADGIGEVGLDPKYSEVSEKSAQTSLFRAQVEVAARLKKPLEVHSRGAEETCLDIMEGYSLASVLMHWFQGAELLDRVLSRPRTFVSFGPAVIYSKKLARMASRCPPDAVLVESDGPVAFEALGGAEGPGLIPSVAFKMAEVWGKSLDDAALQLALNAKRYLGE